MGKLENNHITENVVIFLHTFPSSLSGLYHLIQIATPYHFSMQSFSQLVAGVCLFIVFNYLISVNILIFS